MVVEIKVKIDRVSIDGVVGVNWNADASGNIKRYNDQTRREECSEQLYRVIEAKPEKRTKGDENARALPLCANIQPFNVGPSASLTRCSVEKNKIARARTQFPSLCEKRKKKKGRKRRKREEHGVIKISGIKGAVHWIVGTTGRNNLHLLFAWNNFCCSVYAYDTLYRFSRNLSLVQIKVLRIS